MFFSCQKNLTPDSSLLKSAAKLLPQTSKCKTWMVKNCKNANILLDLLMTSFGKLVKVPIFNPEWTLS